MHSIIRPVETLFIIIGFMQFYVHFCLTDIEVIHAHAVCFSLFQSENKVLLDLS